jgi:hypothetical protein
VAAQHCAFIRRTDPMYAWALYCEIVISASFFFIKATVAAAQEWLRRGIPLNCAEEALLLVSLAPIESIERCSWVRRFC